MLRAIRTTSFRLSVLFAGIFAISFTVLILITYFATMENMRVQLRQTVEDDAAALVADATKEGISSIVDDVNERLRKTPGTNRYYYLKDAAGQMLAGNLGASTGLEGWHEEPFNPTQVTNAALLDDQDHELWGIGTRLADGSFVFAGQDAFSVISTQEAFLQSFAWSMVSALLIAIVAGIFASQSFLSRIDAINTTSLAIINGNLKERIPVKGTSDEVDRLSTNLNRLFDSNQALLDSLKQVTTNIAHDLRSPLSRLRQHLDSVRLESKSRTACAATIDAAIEEADNLLATFSGLLRIAQIESGSRKTGFAPIHLSEIVERVARAYQPVAEDSEKSLTTSIEPDLRIVGDRGLLTQMLANLIENSIRHTSRHTRIALKLEKIGRNIVAEVADTGPGIPMTERENVFERFYRLDASRTTPGHGLGLSLVAAVANLHNIRITLVDSNPGLRTILTFPASELVVGSASQKGNNRSLHARIAILGDL
jgi:signal transduction histidine kinase